jgi:membrane-bound serine protease (ClpP class)
MTNPVRNPARRFSQIHALLRSDVFLFCVVLGWFWLSAGLAPAQQSEGMVVTVPNPITSEAVARIKAQINPRIAEGAAQRPATIIFDFNPEGKAAATPNFGICLDLQSYIITVNRAGLNTVAFVHANVTGHTVLPVLACRELVMSKGAAIGQITGDAADPLDKSKEGIYQDTLALNNRGALGAVIRKMYDPEVKLMKGISKKAGNARVFADARDTDVMKDLVGAVAVAGVQDGQVAAYSQATATDLGLCRATAESLGEIGELYGLPPAALRVDPLLGRTPDVYRWTLKGDIDGATRESLGRVIRDVRKKGGNVLILITNIGGNDLDLARGVADDLRAAQSGEDGIKIIAFITERAPAAGTVIALGCSQIAMFKPKPDATDAREAEIGDFSGYVNPKVTKPAAIEANLGSIRELAELQGYPAILIDGMFKPELEIVRASKASAANHKMLMTREKFDQDNETARRLAGPGGNPDVWNQDKVIKPKGQLLKLNATLAAEVGLARTVVDGTDAKAVAAAYGWSDPKSPDPGWLDKFADFLRMPVVTVLIVVIGFTGLILELKVPGLTVPGIIAALCFILVFWAHSKFSGQTFVLALMLFLLGLVLVGLEIFVLPGFGACGIFGILCMLAGLGLVTLDKIPETPAEWGGLGIRVSQYMFALMGAMALAFFIARFLPKLPGANRLVLNAPSESASNSDALPGAGEAAELLGAIGTSSTPLRPAGVVKFGDKFVDVVSDGGFIPSGTRVQVIQVEGTRIVVKEV